VFLKRLSGSRSAESLLAFVKFAGVELFGMGRFAVTAMAAAKRKSHT